MNEDTINSMFDMVVISSESDFQFLLVAKKFFDSHDYSKPIQVDIAHVSQMWARELVMKLKLAHNVYCKKCHPHVEKE